MPTLQDNRPTRRTAAPVASDDRELRSTLEMLTELARLAQRKARRHARDGRRALAARFAAHTRLIAAHARALQAEIATAGLEPRRVRRG